MTPAELARAAHDAAQAADLGRPSSGLNGFRADIGAGTGGRYVGVIARGDTRERLRGASFDTRADAEEHADRSIERRRARLEADLVRPELGHVRASFGLPRDVTA